MCSYTSLLLKKNSPAAPGVRKVTAHIVQAGLQQYVFLKECLTQKRHVVIIIVVTIAGNT